MQQSGMHRGAMRRRVAMMNATPESITEAELAEALTGMALFRGDDERVKLTALNPVAFAAVLFNHAVANREPRRRAGAYEDSEGNLYVRVPGLNAWLRVMDDGTTEVRPDDSVERPLRKLVPEGSQEAAAVLVAEWRGVGEQDDAVPEWRGGYRAALRKCADELGYALKEGQR